VELAGFELVERHRALLGRRPAGGLLFEHDHRPTLAPFAGVPLIALVAAASSCALQLLEIESAAGCLPSQILACDAGNLFRTMEGWSDPAKPLAATNQMEKQGAAGL